MQAKWQGAAQLAHERLRPALPALERIAQAQVFQKPHCRSQEQAQADHQNDSHRAPGQAPPGHHTAALK
jgi:hypothetical protein